MSRIEPEGPRPSAALCPQSARRHAGVLHRFRRNRDGTSAVEFAIVAAPFFALLFALIEVGLVFFATFTLENAVDRGARAIRTGQAQQAGFDAGQFKTEVCKHVHGLLNCESGLEVDVRKFSTFGGMSLPSPLDEDGNMTDDFTYDPGGAGDIVVVRAFYEWGLIANLPGVGLGNMGNGARLLSASAAFRNEPYDN